MTQVLSRSDDVYAALSKAHSEAFKIVYLKAIIFSSDLGDVARWGGGPKQIAAKQAHGHTHKHAHTHPHNTECSALCLCAVNLALTGNKSFFRLGIRWLSEHH